MLEVKDYVGPSVDQFRIVVKGMRNAFKSWDKSDSGICEDFNEINDLCYQGCPFADWRYAEDEGDAPDCTFNDYKDDWPVFVLGPKDKNLLAGLTKLGTSDRKALRQLPIILEVKAPLYWWKQADKYQIGTTTNSESTMHTLTKKPFEVDDFTINDREFYYTQKNSILEDTKTWGDYMSPPLVIMIKQLNYFREQYLETKDKRYWGAINELLPQSYFQTRTWSLNYEVALSIIDQRMFHDLEEWKTLIIFLLKNAPYLLDLALADGSIKLEVGGFVKGVNDGKEEVLYQLED